MGVDLGGGLGLVIKNDGFLFIKAQLVEKTDFG